jgi:hypothetical protein
MPEITFCHPAFDEMYQNFIFLLQFSTKKYIFLAFSTCQLAFAEAE